MAGELEHTNCPNCGADHTTVWGTEGGFTAVRCKNCGLVYVSPRPNAEMISEANITGEHKVASGTVNVRTRYHPGKVRRYEGIIRRMFCDRIDAGRPIRWLDVGAGYGEFVEAAIAVLPRDSEVIGIEPMAVKVASAKSRGTPVSDTSLGDLAGPFDVISLINVFSHIPDFRSFASGLTGMLAPDGEFLVETGNGGDLDKREDYPDLLYLPDHLVFAGVGHIEQLMNAVGFHVADMHQMRIDAPLKVAKTFLLGLRHRQIKLSLPYTSRFRTTLYRARRSTARS